MKPEWSEVKFDAAESDGSGGVVRPEGVRVQVYPGHTIAFVEFNVEKNVLGTYHHTEEHEATVLIDYNKDGKVQSMEVVW